MIAKVLSHTGTTLAMGDFSNGRIVPIVKSGKAVAVEYPDGKRVRPTHSLNLLAGNGVTLHWPRHD